MDNLQIRRLAIAMAAGSAVAASAHAQTVASRQVLVVDAEGARVQSEYRLGAAGDPWSAPEVPEIIWHFNDPVAIGTSVAVADDANDAWVYWDLNSERVSLFDKEGSGAPVYDVDLVGEDMLTASVASAEEGSLGVTLTVANVTGVLVRGFDRAGGNSPIWDYSFPGGVNGTFGNAATVHYVDVSADGSIVAAVGGDTIASRTYVAILDGSTGQELVGQFFPERISAVELTDDGSRAILTAGADAVVVDTSNLAELHRFGVSGTGSFHRISRNGKAAVAGGFNYVAWVEDAGGNWNQVFNRTQSNNWFGGPAVSADGETMFVASHNYAGGYLELTYRVIDLVTGVELAQTQTIGSGSLQDSVKVAQANEDGTIFAVASWGTQDNVHPEVQVFDRDLVRIAGIDMPGSAYHIDMTRDGSIIGAVGKHVHANTFGNGGDAYSYRVFETGGCPADIDGDGDADVNDFFAYLDLFEAGDPRADITGDGTVDVNDFFAYLDLFEQGC